MILSIGMIVKNEEKYLERCLTALKPILENVDSELIIADTGSTDNTVEIAKKFTDKVYHFEWIDDFSAARNFTMEKSVGEWYMYLDADEIFQSCDEIISFFNSGEYKSYGNAFYTIRSYTDVSDMSTYADTKSSRLAKRYPDVAFENKIHETLTPLHKPFKHLGTIADHYGYLYNDNGKTTEIAYEKSKRNLEMLMECLDKPNVEFSVYREIADCYNIIDDRENALKYINMGLEKLDHKNIAITQYYSYKAAILLVHMDDYDGAIAACNDYFGSDNPSRTKTQATDVDMYAIRGEAYFRKGQFDKAIEDFIQFFKVYKAYKSGKLSTDDLLYNHIKVNNRNIKNIYIMFFGSCISARRFNTAAEYLKGFPVEQLMDDAEFMISHFRSRVEIMEHTGYKGIKKFADSLDDDNKVRFFRALRWKMLSTDKPEELIGVLSELAENNPDFADYVNICRSYFIDDNLQFEQVKEFIQKHGTAGNADILCMMLESNMDISPYLADKYFNANSCAHVMYTDFSDYIYLLETYDMDKLSPEVLVIAESLYGWAMVGAANTERNIVKLFEKYGEIAAKWRRDFPNEESVPGDIRTGFIVRSITDARSNGDLKTCISEMRRLIKTCPDFAPFVSRYQQVLKQEAIPKRSVHSELEEMAASVKHNIRNMISKGNISAAENTLLELEKLCPSDPEIAAMKIEINKLK